jgi:hypothetical protein
VRSRIIISALSAWADRGERNALHGLARIADRLHDATHENWAMRVLAARRSGGSAPRATERRPAAP